MRILRTFLRGTHILPPGGNLSLTLHRRKAGTRATAMTDPVIVDPKIVTTLQSLLAQQLDEVSLLIIHFLYAFVCQAALVESYEADNFILRNSEALCTWYVDASIRTKSCSET